MAEHILLACLAHIRPSMSSSSSRSHRSRSCQYSRCQPLLSCGIVTAPVVLLLLLLVRLFLLVVLVVVVVVVVAVIVIVNFCSDSCGSRDGEQRQGIIGKGDID